MKKVLKVLGVLTGLYAVVNLSNWAIHGIASFFREIEEAGYKIDNVGEYMYNMFKDDLKTIKENWNKKVDCLKTF